MERYSDLQFREFDWLRFPLIVGVVFIHCYGKPFDYEAINFAHFTVIVCVAIYYLLNKYTPSFCKILSGNR